MILISETECTIADLFELLREVVQPENLSLSLEIATKINASGKSIEEMTVKEIVDLIKAGYATAYPTFKPAFPR